MTDLQTVGNTVGERGLAEQGNVGKRKGFEQKDWTIKGLPAETVEGAREAAKSSGMKINAWVSKVLEDAFSNDVPLMGQGKSLSDPSDTDMSREIDKLRSINEDLIRTVKTLSALLAKSELG
ncbi:hypothetical protein [Sphingobium sp. TCM1]|uniref:hypothetical protein n=1 Tax=Sphingobium sp. TCM1 TaxID=453246 RepID=UPI0007F497A6|nr:hypothetical protein [Sphingobium sp. TCM1]OAN57456.1 hypothetical protein A7Q26_16530 [Sphingobium sp. TCM1]